jgi:predicted O-methyltransferase YrrM
VEIGGSTGLSTIALAAAARATGGRVISFEIDPQRQAAAHDTLARLRLIPYVELIPKDATSMLPGMGTVQFALIDCEKEDYIRFFDMLRVEQNGIVVADNILSHALGDYVRHVRSRPRVESMTVTIGAGLEVTRFVAGE